MAVCSFEEGDHVYHPTYKFGIVKSIFKSSVRVEFESGKVINIKHTENLENRGNSYWKYEDIFTDNRIFITFQSLKTGHLSIRVPFTPSYFQELRNERYIEQYGERYYNSQMWINFKEDRIECWHPSLRINTVYKAHFDVHFTFETLGYKRASIFKLYKKVISGIEMKEWENFVRDRYPEDVKTIKNVTD